ncbi:MAG: carboxypeptidase-like regulatory domain-containing protein [Acidobacteria bacterium]|nr:carboxypeptidase-like regulatory domain-containing protein [Acidobacteriota bacterium]MCA1641023.1 carboxypeptidase-like regulatory domain-containing protein [Acidobacteriota bacterium]
MGKSSLRVTVRFFPTILAAALVVAAAAAPASYAKGGSSRRLGTVTGLVRDHKGQPLAGAIIRFVRDGADVVSKQTKTSPDGSFTARVLPGKYLLTAIAEGFNSVSFNSVQVNPSDEISYRFNLEPLGQGRTAPERRADRNDPKWRLRAARSGGSIFHQNERGDATAEIAEEAIADATGQGSKDSDDPAGADQSDAEPADVSANVAGRATAHGVIETYTGFSSTPTASAYVGTNFAVSTPATEQLNLIFAGQFASNGLARFETTGVFRVNARHNVRLMLGGARLPLAASKASAAGGSLSQLSVRAVDEWIVRDGVVVVLGLDYSRFLNSRGASSLSPRVGFAIDANARTRFRAAYSPATDGARAQSSATLETGQVFFPEANEQAVALVDGRAVMERSHRLEFGVERVIDNSSSVEASMFFDTTDGRGVGLMNLPVNGLADASGAELLQVANQQGAARGLRVVYTRRVSPYLQTSAGYSAGRGQQLAPVTLSTKPGDVFRNGFFQTVAAQVDSSFDTGTRVRTVLRFSPRAAVFAIDPFAGRLAVFDPSLSILVTQDLPTFGLPLRAEAMLDARNLLDALTCSDDGETILVAGTNRRSVRGGISVRF